MNGMRIVGATRWVARFLCVPLFCPPARGGPQRSCEGVGVEPDDSIYTPLTLPFAIAHGFPSPARGEGEETCDVAVDLCKGLQNKGIRNKLKLVRFWIQHLPPMEFEAILQDDDENKDYGRSSQNWAIYAPVDGPAGKR